MNTIRPWLHIGGFRDSLNRDLLNDRGIGAVLALDEPVTHEGIETLHLPIKDRVMLKTSTVERGVEFVLDQKNLGHGVMTACGAGISRSVTFAVAALKEAENLELETAMREVSALHPMAAPSQKLWSTLVNYYGEYETCDRIMEILVKTRRQ